MQRDIQNEAANVPGGDAPPPQMPDVHDPAINSPKRARWLAEQAAEAERLRQPFSRRGLFGGGTPKADD